MHKNTGRNTNTGRQESKALLLCSCHLVASLAGLVSSRDPTEPTQAKYLPGCTQIQAYTNTPISRGGVKMAVQLENTPVKPISHHKQCSQHALSLLPASMTPYFNSNTLFVINQRWLQSLSSENYCSPRQAQPYIAQNLLYIANEVWSSIDRIVKVKNHNKIGVYTATGTQNHRGVLPKRAGCELQSVVDNSRWRLCDSRQSKKGTKPAFFNFMTFPTYNCKAHNARKKTLFLCTSLVCNPLSSAGKNEDTIYCSRTSTFELVTAQKV